MKSVEFVFIFCLRIFLPKSALCDSASASFRSQASANSATRLTGVKEVEGGNPAEVYHQPARLPD
jgi:hypothetical protein